MARRATTLGLMVEYKDTDVRRVTTSGLMVEYQDTDVRRVTTQGIMVEQYPGELVAYIGNIASGEAIGGIEEVEVIQPVFVTGVGDIASEEDLTGRTRVVILPPITPLPASICDSLAAYYYVMVCDVYGNVVAIFDDFEKLEYANNIDDVGYFSLKIKADDTRVDLFELDGVVKVMRSVPGLGLDWYADFTGLYRTTSFELTEDGKESFIAIGVSCNDLLRRTAIGYKAGTIRAAKNAVAETAMKEYVYENCGAGSTIANGRQADGVLPGFVIDPDLLGGVVWAGDMAGANLLEVLQDIAVYSVMDFGVEFDVDHYIFKTYNNQYGTDRSVTGLNPLTGKNAAGNYPVIFSKNFSNVRSLNYVYDRVPEVNRVFMLGKGDGSTRTWQTVTSSASLDSIYNRREASRNGSNQEFLYQLTQAGISELENLASRIIIQFSPFQQPSCAYGYHYSVGDRVSLIYRGITMNYKLMGIKVSISQGEESLDINFANEVIS